VVQGTRAAPPGHGTTEQEKSKGLRLLAREWHRYCDSAERVAGANLPEIGDDLLHAVRWP